jgi:hypothetical protein
MTYCGNCGKESDANLRFCSYCGAVLPDLGTFQNQNIQSSGDQATQSINGPSGNNSSIVPLKTRVLESIPYHFLALIAGLIGIIGAFMPWASVAIGSSTATATTYTLAGTSVGIGLLILLLSVACIFVAMMTRDGSRAKESGMITMGIGLTILLFVGFVGLTFYGISGQLSQAVNPPTTTLNQVQVGAGLIIEGLAGFLLLISGIWDLIK